MMTATIHKWEAAGLGAAPYRLIDVISLPSRGLAEANPSGYNNAMRTATEAAHGLGVRVGTCQVCGMGLTDNYVLQASCGKRFVVGCDCVTRRDSESPRMRVDADPLVREVKARKNALARERKLARDTARINAAKALYTAEIRAIFAAEPHPNQYHADQGKTRADYYDWMFHHSGISGALSVARAIEKAAGK